jgi:hypothetical protein
MHDDYNSIIRSDLTFGQFTALSPAGTFDYDLTTPYRAIGSLGFILGKTGLIGMDYEYVDYSGARFSGPGASFSPVNDAVRTKYTSASNVRIGAEWRYDNLSFRAGYAMYGTPFNAGQNVPGADQSKTSITGGIGLRDKNYFLDLGYAYSQSTEYLQQYSLLTQDVPGSKNKVETNNFVLTFGVKF